MNLQDMTKEEILEAIDCLHEWDAIDPESLPTERDRVTLEAEKFWQQCVKYRQPLIDFIYRQRSNA